MSFSIVQTASAISTSPSAATSLSPTITAVTAGNLVVIAGGYYNSTTENPSLSVSDSASQMWTVGPTAVLDTAAKGKVGMWCFANSASITTVTLSSGVGAANSMAARFWEISGVATSNAVDVTGTATGGATEGTAPSLTAGVSTSQANEFAVGVVVGAGGNYAATLGSVTAGWNASTAIHGLIGGFTYGYNLFGQTQTLSSETVLTLAGTISSNQYWGDLFMTFKAPGGAPATAGMLPFFTATGVL